LDAAAANTVKELANVRAVYLNAAFDEISQTWGSVKAYLRDQAGMDDELRKLLHARLLVQ
jgi:protein tyrosine/serine phosphatase